MTRLQQEIENLKAERAPGGEEKVNTGSEGPVRCCCDLSVEGFLEDCSKECDAKKDRPVRRNRSSEHTLLNCFSSQGFLRFPSPPFSSTGG